MDRWKAEQGRGREKRKIRRKKGKKKEDADAWKGRKVAIHCVFPMICGSGGSKSRLAKAAGAEPAGQMRDEKLHAVVARSTFPSQNVQNTPASDHFWKLRCRKSARRCGSKSKCTKHHMFAPLFEVQMSKKCTPLWRDARFEVKMLKTAGFGPLLKVQMSLRFTTLHYTTLHSTTLRATTLHYITQHYNHYNYNYTTTQLHSTTLHYTSLHSTTLNYTTLQLHYTTLHSTTLHYITLHCTTFHYT